MTKTFDRLFPYIFLTLGLCLAYFPCISQHYVYHDDVNFFLQTPTQLTPKTYKLSLTIGRFVGANIYALYGFWVNTVEDLRSVRWVSFAQLLLCSWIMMPFLHRFWQNRWLAAATSLMIFTLPPFQVIVFEAGMAFQTSGVLFSLLATLCVNQIPSTQPFLKRFRSAWFFASLLFFYAAIATHPSTSMIYWAVVGMVFLTFLRSSFQEWLAKVSLFGGVGIITLGIYALSLKVFHQMWAHKVMLKSYNPYQTTTDFVGKFTWFIQEPLINIFNFWKIFPMATLAYSLMGIIVVSLTILSFPYFKKKKWWLALALMFTLLIFSYLPNLLTEEKAPFYRCYAGIMPLALILFLWSSREIIPFKKMTSGFFIILSCFSVFWAHQTIQHYRVYPSQVEYAYLKENLVKGNINVHKHIHIIKKDRDVIQYRYDEFGIPTANFSGDIMGLLSCLLQDMARGVLTIEEVAFDRKQHLATFVFKNNQGQTKVHRTKLTTSMPNQLPAFTTKPLILDLNPLYAEGGKLHYLKNRK